jgi:hypothetical protein
MPTLLLEDGFKFFFYANEHEPKHVHVEKGGDFAKIEILTLRVTRNYLKPKELKKALKIAAEHREEFERKWDDWFSRKGPALR